MRLVRFRKPSIKSAIGITRAKRRIKKATGITAATKPLRLATNAKRKALSSVGYYSFPMALARFIAKYLGGK